MQSVAISSKILQSCFFNSHKFLSAYISVSINSGPGLGNKGAVSIQIGLPCLRKLYVRYMKCPNTPGPSSIILSIYNKMGIILHCNERANFFRK